MCSSSQQFDHDGIQKIEKAFNESSYRETIKNLSRYNKSLVSDRKTRLPFIDSQTGVAQHDSLLWMKSWQRMPGQIGGQLYSYPSKRWKIRRRQYLLNDSCFFNKSIFDAQESLPITVEIASKDTESIENCIKDVKENGKELAPANGKEETKEIPVTINDHDENDDFLDATEIDEPDTDVDDEEEFTIRKKKKKKEVPKKKKDPDEKPYVCSFCGVKYKTRPGLNYHVTHSHGNNNGKNNDKNTAATDNSSVATATLTSMTPDNQSTHENQDSAKYSSGQSSSDSGQSNGQSTTSGPVDTHLQSLERISEKIIFEKQLVMPNSYCDFCLGNSDDNKKNRSAEKLVSCSDCGRSAHPSCLQFTPNMITSVAKYRWQCIECKSCGLCGSSDNDEKLLFCDDCDRGYHMYCLKPPISEPPEGEWSCHLCIKEYHRGKLLPFQ